MSALKNMTWATKLIIAVTALLLLFQAAHFLEHIFQIAAWIVGDKTRPFMTAWANWLVVTTGAAAAPTGGMARQHMLGMELLHLVGNGMFMVGLFFMQRLVPTPGVKAAFWIEAFHFYEHLSLTVSAFVLGRPIGLSTLFGYAGPKTFMVGYRIWWHFIMNLIPSTLAIAAIAPFIAIARDAFPILGRARLAPEDEATPRDAK